MWLTFKDQDTDVSVLETIESLHEDFLQHLNISHHQVWLDTDEISAIILLW